MSKERLERIKERVNYVELDRTIHGHIDDDIVWLIKQAERVQDLEKRLKIYQKRSWFEDYEKVAKQNKRYREALEFYADKKNYLEMIDPSGVLTVIEEDEGEKARKALEGAE